MNCFSQKQPQSFQEVIGRNSMYLLMNTIGSGVLNFICAVLLARYLGVENYGVIIFANYLMLFMFGIFGNDLSGVKLISQNMNNQNQLGIILKGVFIYHVIFALSCAFLLLLFSIVSDRFIPLNISIHMRSISIIVVVNIFIGMFGSFWDGFQRMNWIVLTDVVPKSLKLLGFAILVWYGLGLGQILWSWGGIYFIYTITVLPLLFRLFIKGKAVFLGVPFTTFPHKTYLVYGMFLKIPGLTRSFVPFIISFYLGYIMVDSSKIGLYGAANGIAAIMFILVGPISRALFPSLSQLYSQNKMDLLMEISIKTYRYFGLLIFVGVAVLIFWRQNIVQWVYGSEFQGASQIFGYLCIAIFFECLKHITYVLLNATNHASVLSIVEGIGIMFILTMGVILIRQFGVFGAAVTVTISAVFTSILGLMLVQRLIRIKMNQWIINALVALFTFLLVIHLPVNVYSLIFLIVTLFLFIRDVKVAEVSHLFALLVGKSGRFNRFS
ncbi:MAG: oligosaccharide flippase family protein [Candidatus Omnitrophota bacterium]